MSKEIKHLFLIKFYLVKLHLAEVYSNSITAPEILISLFRTRFFVQITFKILACRKSTMVILHSKNRYLYIEGIYDFVSIS